MKKKLKAGDEIDSYCGRCKLELNHSIIAMVADAPKRVRCLTCNAEHNFRLLKKTTKKTTKTKTKSKTTRRSTRRPPHLAKWTTSMESWDELRARSYKPSESFQVDDLVVHSKFGKGIVTTMPSPDRIIALFECGEKMLMHGRAPQ